MSWPTVGQLTRQDGEVEEERGDYAREHARKQDGEG